MKSRALIIFAKNPITGKVKTRLASTIGNDRALDVYRQLQADTLSAVRKFNSHVFIFYSDEVIDNDYWNEIATAKHLQQGEDLGDRMSNAFKLIFEKGYQLVCIIGTDCPELSNHHLEAAYQRLENAEVVLGPAIDGGYYLIGMKCLQPALFTNVQWSTSKVTATTIARLNAQRLSYELLPELRDVDQPEDLDFFPHLSAIAYKG